MQPPKPTFMMLQHGRLGLYQHGRLGLYQHGRLGLYQRGLEGPYPGPGYLNFSAGTGEPYTLIEQTLTVSGSKPRGPVRPFTKVTDGRL